MLVEVAPDSLGRDTCESQQPRDTDAAIGFLAHSLLRREGLRLKKQSRFRHARSNMSKKRKPKLKPAKEARRRARAGIGLPPPQRTIPNRREKSERHKETLRELLDVE